jgi:hypothetical protein
MRGSSSSLCAHSQRNRADGRLGLVSFKSSPSGALFSHPPTGTCVPERSALAMSADVAGRSTSTSTWHGLTSPAFSDSNISAYCALSRLAGEGPKGLSGLRGSGEDASFCDLHRRY